MVEWSALRKSFLMIGCVNLRSDRGTIAPANRQEITLERYFKGAIKTIYERAVKMNDLSKLSQWLLWYGVLLYKTQNVIALLKYFLKYVVITQCSPEIFKRAIIWELCCCGSKWTMSPRRRKRQYKVKDDHKLKLLSIEQDSWLRSNYQSQDPCVR